MKAGPRWDSHSPVTEDLVRVPLEVEVVVVVMEVYQPVESYPFDPVEEIRHSCNLRWKRVCAHCHGETFVRVGTETHLQWCTHCRCEDLCTYPCHS